MINVKLSLFTQSAVVIYINRYILHLIIILYYTKIRLQFCKWQYHWTKKLKKEPWIVCVSVCQPVLFGRGPFRYLPRKLPCNKDLQTCSADGKLHAQPHMGRVR